MFYETHHKEICFTVHSVWNISNKLTSTYNHNLITFLILTWVLSLKLNKMGKSDKKSPKYVFLNRLYVIVLKSLIKHLNRENGLWEGSWVEKSTLFSLISFTIHYAAFKFCSWICYINVLIFIGYSIQFKHMVIR